MKHLKRLYRGFAGILAAIFVVLMPVFLVVGAVALLYRYTYAAIPLLVLFLSYAIGTVIEYEDNLDERLKALSRSKDTE